MRFDGKVAIVTGSTRGVGLATARLLAAHGAQVVINGRDPALTEAVVGELSGQAVGVACDVADNEAPSRLVEAAIESWGRLDMVVNNAGYPLDGPLHKLGDRPLAHMLELHVTAPFRILREAAPHLREPAKRELADGQEVFRKVVNVSSVSATMGQALQTPYAAAKAGLIGLTRALAKEWGPLRINVNAVALGVIDTRLTAPRTPENAILAAGEQVRAGAPARWRQEAIAGISLGRMGTPEEAARAIAFLCSSWSDYIHGQVLHVTGGWAIGLQG